MPRLQEPMSQLQVQTLSRLVKRGDAGVPVRFVKLHGDWVPVTMLALARRGFAEVTTAPIAGGSSPGPRRYVATPAGVVKEAEIFAEQMSQAMNRGAA